MTTQRQRVALACSECGQRNYQTTRAKKQGGRLELKKYCKSCKTHTLHKEAK